MFIVSGGVLSSDLVDWVGKIKTFIGKLCLDPVFYFLEDRR